MRNLRESPLVRQQPEPLDGGHEAALQPEPAARARLPRRDGEARLCLHPLPEGGESPKSSADVLAGPGPILVRDAASVRLRRAGPAQPMAASAERPAP